MTVLSPDQIVQLWVRNGGNPLRARVAASVALAESGGNTDAISPTGDYGVWQINVVHFPGRSPDVVAWQNPDVNAGYAIRISNDGLDWGPWCTCWVDPVRDCGKPLGPLPQVGSPAYGKLAGVFGGGVDVPGAPPGAGGVTGLTGVRSAWNGAQDYFHNGLAADVAAVVNAQSAIVALRSRMGA